MSDCCHYSLIDCHAEVEAADTYNKRIFAKNSKRCKAQLNYQTLKGATQQTMIVAIQPAT
jgi:hypothetical protein